MKRNISEITIIGAGFIGSITALLLDQAGCNVTLIDPANMNTPTSDMRATALNRNTCKILKTINALNEKNAAPINAIKVREANVSCGSLSPSITYDALKLVGSPFGMVINNHLLLTSLRSQLKKSNVTILQNSLKHLDPGDHSNAARITLNDNTTLKSMLVIGADGRFSKTRQECKIACTQKPYQQNALIANLTLNSSSNGIAMEHFTPSGPFALVPLQHNNVGMIYCDTPKRISFLASSNEKTLLKHLAPRVYAVSDGELKLAGLASKIFSYPLSLMHAQQYFCRRVVLVGDAAHVIHPIAGLGLNLGVRDAENLTKNIIKTKTLGSDPANNIQLAKYQNQRRIDVYKHILITDGFDFLYRRHAHNPSLTFARRHGFGIVSGSHLLKKLLSGQASYT